MTEVRLPQVAPRSVQIRKQLRPGARVVESYRRDDTAADAGRLADALLERFGEDAVFMDDVNIAPGGDFAEVIRKAINSCDVLIALIGKAWLTAADEAGHRGLDDPHDFVRLEIQGGLGGEICLLPTLVQGGAMPGARPLPGALAPPA